MKIKKLLANICLMLALVVGMTTMTACSTAQVGGGLVGLISSTWGWSVSQNTSEAFTVNFGDTLTKIGISQGSSARVNFLNNNRIRVDFKIKLGINAGTKKVEQELTSIFQQLLGRNDVKITSSSSSSASTALNFSLLFG